MKCWAEGKKCAYNLFVRKLYSKVTITALFSGLFGSFLFIGFYHRSYVPQKTHQLICIFQSNFDE